MAEEKTIAVFLDQSAGSAAQWLRGMARFARTRDDWTLVNMGTLLVTHASDPGMANVNGVIVSMVSSDTEALAALKAWKVPVVNLLQSAPPLNVSAVCPDNEAAGRLAAEHLLALGMRRFGYLQMPGAQDDSFRFKGFTQAIRAVGGQYSAATIPSLWERMPSEATVAEVGEWIHSIGCPCGVLAFNDAYGSAFVRVVRKAGYRVPDDVAVVGIDDHDVLCEFCNPPLSSVNLNYEVVAYQAAALLDRLMRARRRSAHTQTLIPPIGVIERASSQMLAVEDDVARVLRLMSDRFNDRLTVRQMAAHIQVSERTLETKFQRCLGRSPSEEMGRLRVERAKRLLIETEKSIVRIADDAGFANAGHFCYAFKQKMQMTPGGYRRGMRGGGAKGE